MRTKICVSIPARKQNEAVRLLKKAESLDVDLAEIRFDYAEEELKPKLLSEAIGLPLVATNRVRNEGGHFSGTEEERIETLFRAVEVGFKFVDLELSTHNYRLIIKQLATLEAQVIISHHNFERTPTLEEMRQIVNQMQVEEASIYKLVTTAVTTVDNLVCLNLISEVAGKIPIICFAMGDKGLLSRIFSTLFGASWTYASLEEGLGTAPGQIEVTRLRQVLEFLGG